MIRSSPCLRDNVVYLKYLEREVHPATSAPALLFAVEDVLVLTVRDRRVYVRASRYVRAGRHLRSP